MAHLQHNKETRAGLCNHDTSVSMVKCWSDLEKTVKIPNMHVSTSLAAVASKEQAAMEVP